MFYLKKTLTILSKCGPIFFLLMFLVIIYAFYVAINDVSTDIAKQQLEVLESGLMRMTIQHYAIEGSYPESLDVLINEYGFTYDSETFVVHYENLGDNLLPQTSVFLKQRL